MRKLLHESQHDVEGSRQGNSHKTPTKDGDHFEPNSPVVLLSRHTNMPDKASTSQLQRQQIAENNSLRTTTQVQHQQRPTYPSYPTTNTMVVDQYATTSTQVQMIPVMKD